ncbi:MAG: type II toxin-antitoxin system VapC family toxin [Atopobiaceae bacterium]|jgi:predicted nucleic acid-binding protein
MIVMDCSAAINIVRATPEGRGLRGLMVIDERCLAPDLFRAEAANALTKYVRAGQMNHSEALGLFCKATALVNEFHPLSENDVEALSEACRLGHSVYDMFYFTLARRYGATLFTEDRRLIELCDREGVECIHPTRLSAPDRP